MKVGSEIPEPSAAPGRALVDAARGDGSGAANSTWGEGGISSDSADRSLLAIYRQFVRELHGTKDRTSRLAILGDILALLRRSPVSHTSHEERQEDGRASFSEGRASTQAFLNAEVVALAAALADPGGDRRAGKAGVEQHVLRHLHRIEVVLELGGLDADDGKGCWAVSDGTSRAGHRGGAAPTRVMDPAEIQRFLLQKEWGILCTMGEVSPYGVPVSYGFDGRFLYVASGAGLKRRNLEAHAAVCITVAEVDTGDRWSSVVVTGEAREITELRGKWHGLRSIHRQRTAGALPSGADLVRLARASVFRITVLEMTGRVRG